MNRRRFLTVGSTVGLSLASGCLGYSVVSTDEMESRKARIDSLEQTTANLNATLREREDRIESLEAELSAATNETDRLKRERRTLIEDQLSALYRAGSRFYTGGEESYQTGNGAANDREYTAASRAFGVAFGKFDGATEFFYRTYQLAETDGYTDGMDVSEAANEYCVAMRDACDDFSVAMRRYANGDDSEGDDLVESGNALYEEAQNYAVRRPAHFDSQL